MCLYNLEIDIILDEIAPLRYKDIIQGSDIELLNLLSDTIHGDLVLFLLESNDKKIWTSTEFRYFDEKNGRAICSHKESARDQAARQNNARCTTSSNITGRR